MSYFADDARICQGGPLGFLGHGKNPAILGPRGSREDEPEWTPRHADMARLRPIFGFPYGPMCSEQDKDGKSH